MDHINFVFSSNALNPVYQLSIRAALGIAKRTLNRYYNLTDDSENYRIAMGMLSMSVYTLICLDCLLLFFV